MILKYGPQRRESMMEHSIPQQQVNGLVPSPILSPASKKRKASEISGSVVLPPTPLTNGVTTSCENAAKGTPLVAETMAKSKFEWPTEIPHLTEGYGPIAHIVQRLSQDTFRELSEMIRWLSRLHQEQGLDAATATARKKKEILAWAEKRRSQWIKLAVTQQWADRMPEIYEMVDLKLWLGNQRLLYDHLGFSVGQVKKDMVPAMLPQPDIDTALRTLSEPVEDPLIRAFKPKKRLSSKQLLRTLQQMNVILSIRLSQIDGLPLHLRSYTIHDGRATFKFQDEFEFDITVGDEDPASPFFFLDLRLAFISHFMTDLDFDKFKNRLEHQLNYLLGAEGIPSACYFLHDLVLTLKLNLLRQEAVSLAHDSWNDLLQVSQIQRTLVVQYWATKPGPKSWIEVGILSGERLKDPISGDDHNWSRIGIRWFRDGQEQSCRLSLFDQQALSLEGTLSKVIAKHVQVLFNEIYQELSDWPVYSRTLLALDATASSVDASQSVVHFQLTTDRDAKLAIDLKSGSFQLQPTSSELRRCEGVLNAPVNQQVKYEALDRLRGEFVEQDLVKAAEEARWEAVQLDGKQYQALSEKLSGPRRSRLKLFRPPGWSASWVVVVCLNRLGDQWHVVGQIPGQTQLQENVIPLPDVFDGEHRVKEIYTASRLEEAQRAIAPIVVEYCLNRALTAKEIPFEYSPQSPRVEGVNARFRSIIVDTISYTQSLTGTFSATQLPPTFGLRYQAMTKLGTAILIADFRFSARRLARIVDAASRLDFDIGTDSESGNLVLRFYSPIGANPVANLGPKIKLLNGLLESLECLSDYSGVKIEHSALDTLLLRYSDAPYLAAEVIHQTANKKPPGIDESMKSTSSGTEDAISLRFKPSDGNPHEAVVLQLSRALEQPQNRALGPMVKLLLATKTLFLKLKDLTSPQHVVHIQGPTLVYVTFDRLGKLEARLARNCFGQFEWCFRWQSCFSASASKSVQSSNEYRIAKEVAQELRDMFASKDGECWIHLDSAFSCSPENAGKLLDRVDQVLMGHLTKLPTKADGQKRSAPAEESVDHPTAKRPALSRVDTAASTNGVSQHLSDSQGQREEEAIVLE